MRYFKTLDKQSGGKGFTCHFPARTGCDLTPTLIAEQCDLINRLFA